MDSKDIGCFIESLKEKSILELRSILYELDDERKYLRRFCRKEKQTTTEDITKMEIMNTYAQLILDEILTRNKL